MICLSHLDASRTWKNIRNSLHSYFRFDLSSSTSTTTTTTKTTSKQTTKSTTTKHTSKPTTTKSTTMTTKTTTTSLPTTTNVISAPPSNPHHHLTLIVSVIAGVFIVILILIAVIVTVKYRYSMPSLASIRSYFNPNYQRMDDNNMVIFLHLNPTITFFLIFR